MISCPIAEHILKMLIFLAEQKFGFLNAFGQRRTQMGGGFGGALLCPPPSSALAGVVLCFRVRFCFSLVDVHLSSSLQDLCV